MNTKIFSDSQVWDLWSDHLGESTYINSKGTSVKSVGELQNFPDFEVLVREQPVQRTATPSQQEISPNQGDCIASKVHLMCVELQLMYSYLPVTEEFIVDYSDMTFKLKTFEDVGKLRHMVTLIEELSYEE